MATTRKDVAALTGAATADQPAQDKPKQDPAPADQPAAARAFMSEGTRQDLQMHGRAVEPSTGTVFTKDPETGEVTATERVPEN